MPGAVLLVEDEDDVVELMRDFLELEGWSVQRARDGQEALAALDGGQVGCVLLDVMLPGESGFDLCRRIRRVSDVPILFLSARGGDADKIRGLGLGADDYVVKSATPSEVVARIKAVVRRAGAPPAAEGRRLRFGQLEVDLAAHEARLRGQPVRLTPREFAVLRLLVEHPRQVFSRDHVFELLWGEYGDRGAVAVYVRRLREKLEDDPRQPRLIATVWGVGYRFDPPT